MMKNGVLLSVYPDGLGSDLKELGSVLKHSLAGIVENIHLLPFFPSSGDRGFAPVRYDETDPRLGSWADVEKICSEFPVMCDFMVNHLSPLSPFFQDVIRKGKDSEYWKLFLHWNEFWGSCGPCEEEYNALYRRRPVPPYTDYRLADGQEERFWTTFSSQQIDIDISFAEGKQFVSDTLRFLSGKHIACVRLDAVACTTKKRGSSCFFVEPEIYEVLDWIRCEAEKDGLEMLPEIHGDASMRAKLSDRGYFTYDFALPMLMLYSLYSGNSAKLAAHLRSCPDNQLTILDTHDGIGVIDAKSLLSEEEISFVKDSVFRHGKDLKSEYNTMLYGNLDIYQINTTYYSALGNDDNAYLIARAVQFFAPGIPQVYYVGLLAGPNDVELLELTKNGRDINRHSYSIEEFEIETKRPAVQALFLLCKFRNTSQAFQGKSVLDVEELSSSVLRLTRTSGTAQACMTADFSRKTMKITETVNGRTRLVFEINASS